MKKRIFYSLALISALAAAGGLLLAWAAQRFGLPLLWLCVGAAALLALLLLLGSVLSTRAVQPILRPMEEFSEHPDRDGPVEREKAYPELSPFFDKIRERQRSLLRQIAELIDDRDATRIITDNMQKELERQRKDFSEDISQLRAPLSAISGLAEQVGRDTVSAEETRRLAGLIIQESTRSAALIDDMLCLSRLDDTAPIPMTRVSLTAVCREALTSLSLVAHRRGVGLKLIGPEVWVRGNAGMLGELMTCLCENAILYNHPEGTVLVETGGDPAAETVWAAVRDTGIGIPEEFFQRIFDRFYRVDEADSHQAEGTGLGLSIAKRLADFHQGRITLESAPGEGSVFTVTFPAWNGGVPQRTQEAGEVQVS